MRLLSAFSCLLFGGASAATNLAKILMRDAITQPSDFSLTPETAKLVLANRIGLSDSYSISTSDAGVIEQVASLGGPQQRPFSSEHGYQRILVVIEDESMLEDDNMLIYDDGKQFTPFYMFPTPDSVATEELLNEFRSVSSTHPGDSHVGPLPQALIELSKRPGNSLATNSGRIIAHIKSSKVRQDFAIAYPYLTII
jgi:hypothetical protein